MKYRFDVEIKSIIFRSNYFHKLYIQLNLLYHTTNDKSNKFKKKIKFSFKAGSTMESKLLIFCAALLVVVTCSYLPVSTFSHS